MKGLQKVECSDSRERVDRGWGFVIATNTSKPAYSSDIGMFTLATKSFIADSWNRSLEHYIQLCWYTFSITEAAIMECF